VLRASSLALSAIDHLRGADFSTRFVLAALRAGEPGRVLTALATEANFAAAVGAGHGRYGRKVVAATEALLTRYPDGVAHGYHEAGLCVQRFMGGEWRPAHERAMSAEMRFAALRGTFYERSLNRFFALWSLFYLGEMDELCRLAPLWAQEARGRGDLFGVSGVQLGLANLAWLDLEGPEAARARVDEIMSSWSVQGYHLQHYWALLARTHLDLSEGRGDQALERLRADWPRIVEARLLLMPAVYHEGHHLRARALVAAAAARPPEARRPLLRAALKDVRRLERVGLGWTMALGALLRAGVSELSGQRDETVHRLETAVTRLDEADMGLYAAVARERLAERVGGDRAEILAGLANERYERQRVRRRAEISAMLGPGLSLSPH
jgi:hypothetical protein